MPMSYNAWLYGYGNPVRYVDPSGEIPSSTNHFNSSIQYDLTGWIPLELNDWVNDPIVMNLRNDSQETLDVLSNTLSCDSQKNFIVGMYLSNEISKISFLQKYHGGNALKDIKRKIQKDLGESIVLCSSINSCRWVDYSVPGNILFGYIRKAIEAPKVISDPAGGVLELSDNIKNWIKGKEFNWELKWVWEGSVGDNPEDYKAVTMGEELWEMYEDDLDRQKIEQILTKYLYQLQVPNNDIPATPPKWEENSYLPGRINNYGE